MFLNFNIESLVRNNIRDLKPYSSARGENAERDVMLLDANESPYNNGLNRYPEPVRDELRVSFLEMLRREGYVSVDNITTSNIFIGNGSDEAIDVLMRIFCTPGRDSVLSIAPTYGMYKVAAQINDITYKECSLDNNFALNSKKLLSMADYKTKIIFLCSPNNPTGNLLERESVLDVIENFGGIVVVDEAYADFAKERGYESLVEKYKNLVVLRTMSKAFGLASSRVGFAISSSPVISYMQKVKYPYNVSLASQDAAIRALTSDVGSRVESIVSERERVAFKLKELSFVKRVYPSEANFLLVEVADPVGLTAMLKSKGIVVRDRSGERGCEGCVRITIGTSAENELLMSVLSGNENKRYGPVKEFRRITKETSVVLRLPGEFSASAPFVKTGVGFLDHMLELFIQHSGVKMELTVEGDLETDAHHTIEDTAIVLGEAVEYLYRKAGSYNRYGFALPMDESAAEVLLDLGGRFAFKWEASLKNQFIGDFPTEMLSHFFYSLASAGKFTLHMRAAGENEHHIAEALFKSFARALRIALSRNAAEYDAVPSSKGVI